MKINKIDKEILEILNEARENRSGLYEGKADLFLVLKEKYNRGQFDYSIRKLKDESLIKSLRARGVYKITEKGIRTIKSDFPHYRKMGGLLGFGQDKYRTTTVSVKVDMDHPDFDGVEKELQRNGFEDTGRVDNGKTYWKKEKLHKFYDNPTSEDIKKAKEKIRKETEENIIYRGVLN